MKHDRSRAGLWDALNPLYLRDMTRKLYNIRLLGDRKFRDPGFDAFLDGYSASLDVHPSCDHPASQKPLDSLWEDFVRISSDFNRSTVRKVVRHANE